MLGGEDTSAYVHALALILINTVFTITMHAWSMEAWRQGMDLRTATIGLIYRKALRVKRYVLAPDARG